MAEPQNKLYVAHDGDLAVLTEHWAAARNGEPRFVHLSAPIGGGKRAMVGELCRQALDSEPDTLLWRVSLHDEEDGLQTLLRIYAGLYAGLHRASAGGLKGRVEMMLNSQLPQEPKRVQGWINAFIEGLKKAAPTGAQDGKVQVTLPRDNPLLGLIEVAVLVTRKFPTILEIQNLHHCQSLAVHALIEALMAEASETRLLTLLGTEQLDDAARGWWSPALLDLLERRADDIHAVTMSPWTGEHVGKYLESKELSGDADGIATAVDGRPGFIAELVDWLDNNGKLADLGGLTLADVCDVTPDADELEAPEGEPEAGKRRHATADDAEQIAFISALLGLSFPSGLVADMLGLERDSVDDLLDATEDVYKELQFSKPLGSWIYQFHRALLRESVLTRHQSDDDLELTRRVAAFMQRYLVPRGYAYLIKTMRLWAESGLPQNAAGLRSAALTNDRPETWGMAFDLTNYFDEVDWPAAMKKTIYMNLVDRMVKQGNVEQAEKLLGEATKFAGETEDRPMTGWLLFAGSRLDHRRQDLYRARDRANDALKIFTALDDKTKQAEVRGHLAMIELADGSPNAALAQVEQAETLAPVPPIKAHAEYVRGIAARRSRNLQQAAEHFRKANELAGTSGQGQLALESGLNYGETLLMSGQHSKAADVLGRVVQIAGALNNPVRQRASLALLAQSHAALRNWEAALQAGQQTLQLTRNLKFTQLESVDLYNLGFFNLMMGRATEAVTLMRQAKAGADATNANFHKELLFNLGGALKQIGELESARENLEACLAPAAAAKDWRKVMGAHDQLADIAQGKGDADGARRHLQQALDAADKGGLKEDRKGLRRKLESLA